MADLTKEKSRLLRKAAAFRSQIANSIGPPKSVKATSSAVIVDQHSQNVSLHRVLEALDHPIYVIDVRDYTVKLANSAAHCGLLSEETTCYALTHNFDAPCSGAEYRCPLEEIKKTRKPVTTEHIHYDKDGNRRTFEVHGYPLFDSQGNLTQVIVNTLDITERKRAEKALRQSEERYRTILRIALDGFTINDLEGRLLEVNDSYCKMTGYTREELLGMSITDLEAVEKSEETAQHVKRIMEQGYDRFETQHKRKDGKIIDLEISANFVEVGEGQVFVSVRDITERKRAETRDYQYQQQLKSLVLQLTHAEEQEQKRIADLLHDNLAQALVFLKIRVGLLSQEACSTVEAQALTEINHSLQELLDKTRDLSFELSSPLLYTHGLESALKEWLAEKVERKHGIETRLEEDESPKPLPEKLRVLLFRSTQELVTNVAKHAEANQVIISIEHREHGVEIGVRDDGKGFAVNKAEEINGYGLFRIRERLASAGGDMEVTSEPGQGTLVRLRVPLDAIENTAENKR